MQLLLCPFLLFNKDPTGTCLLTVLHWKWKLNWPAARLHYTPSLSLYREGLPCTDTGNATDGGAAATSAGTDADAAPYWMGVLDVDAEAATALVADRL
jgi:hypothetical protein